MVEPQNTTMMMDTGQTNDRCAMGNPNYGDYNKERVDLVENETRNQVEGQQQVKESMMKPCIASTASSTGQVDIRNMFDKTKDEEMNKVSAEKDKKQERKQQNSEENEDADMADDEQRLTIEVELNKEDAADADEAAGLSLSYMVNLIKAWMKDGMIQGVCDVKGNVKIDNWKGVEDWTMIPNVVCEKNCMLVEMIVSLKTVNSTIQLYSNQRKMCNDKKMKLMAKRTDMEHVKRIGFIVGPCLKIATPKTYEGKIYKESQLEKGMIEIKKKITVEQNLKSRVFMAHALEDEAECIDEQMCETTFNGFKCSSFKLNQPMVRIAAMHANDVLNVKARFETLCGAKVDDEVLKDGKQSKFEDSLKEQKIDEEPLFIAVE